MNTTTFKIQPNRTKKTPLEENGHRLVNMRRSFVKSMIGHTDDATLKREWECFVTELCKLEGISNRTRDQWVAAGWKERD